AYSYLWREIRVNDLNIPNFYDISNGSGEPVVSDDNSQERNYGVFGDLTFGFRNYLFLNMTGRNDWTSTLAKGNNSYFYPGVGISFVATDAFEALKNNNVLSFAKVTASNSTVYNDLEAYQINERFNKHDSFPYGSIAGFVLSGTTVDSEIKKEKLNTTEIGLNLGFFKSRLNLDASYFITKTTDLITKTTPSRAAGATSFLTNIGELKGKGFELTLGGQVLKLSDFTWDLSLNYSSNKTTVVSIKEGVNEIQVYEGLGGQYGIFAVVGESYPQLKTNTYVRDPGGRIVIDPNTGWPKTNAELSNMGKTVPDYILGATSAMRFKGFNVSATMDYRTGHVFYSQGKDYMEFTGRSLESVSANRQDFVIPNSVIETSDGVYVENTNIPVSGGRQSYWTDVYNDVKENYVTDATAFKIRELAINYTLPASILGKTPMQKLTIGFIARNLFTLLPAENSFSDPEFNNQEELYGYGDISNNAVGIGGFMQMPPTRSFGVNLNIEF
ncbi:MAG: TonB-dependent receptor, partial [Bacteroidales bacterium]|nr:TonB-dependent receptor [Bacteroidales bacterium]